MRYCQRTSATAFRVVDRRLWRLKIINSGGAVDRSRIGNPLAVARTFSDILSIAENSPITRNSPSA